MTSSSLDPTASYQGWVAGGCSRPYFCCPQVPAPDSTSKAVGRSLGIGGRRPQGLSTLCLPLISINNLSLRLDVLDGVARRNELTQWSFPSSTLRSPPPSGPRVRLCTLRLHRSALPMNSCPRFQAESPGQVSCRRHKSPSVLRVSTDPDQSGEGRFPEPLEEWGYISELER